MGTPTNSDRLLAWGAIAGTPGASPVLTSIEHRGHTLTATDAALTDPSYNSNRTAGVSRKGNRTVTGDVTYSPKPVVNDKHYENFFRKSFVANKLTHGKENIPLYFHDVVPADIPFSFGFIDMYANTCEVSINDGVDATVKFGYVGRDSVINATVPVTTTTAAVKKNPFIHVDCTFKIGGVVIGYMTAFTLSMNNGLTANTVLGTPIARTVTHGNFTASGSFSMLAETVALFTKWRDSTREPIIVEMSNGTEKLIWTVLNPFITDVSAPFDSDGVIKQNVTFNADPDAATGNIVTLDRVVAP